MASRATASPSPRAAATSSASPPSRRSPSASNGLDLDEVRADPGEVFRRVTGDPQLRWLAVEKGVIHLATAAVVNAVWDMWARAEGKPLWALVADFTPEQFVAAVPFQYLTDAIDPGSARELLEERAAGKAERRAEMARDGFPAYTTSAGWLGYTEEEIRRLAREAVAEGWNDVKMKVGGPPEEDAKPPRSSARRSAWNAA